MIYNTINSWYYTIFLWIKWTMESVLCDFKLLISRSSFQFFSWMRSACVLKNVINMMKIFIKFILIHSLYNISLSNLWSINHFYVCKQQYGFILHGCFFVFFTFESINLKYVTSLQFGRMFEPSISKNMLLHILRSEVGPYFPCFLVAYLAHIFSYFMWQFSNYF